MNTPRLVTLSRLVLAAGLVAASVGAQAGGGVYWAVNVDAPIQGAGRVATTVSNTRHGMYGHGAPVVYAPPAVVYAPPPVVVQRQPVYVQQPVVYERPAPRRCLPHRWAWHRHHGHHHGQHYEDRYAWRDERDEERMIVPRGGQSDRGHGRYDDRGEYRSR